MCPAQNRKHLLRPGRNALIPEHKCFSDDVSLCTETLRQLPVIEGSERDSVPERHNVRTTRTSEALSTLPGPFSSVLVRKSPCLPSRTDVGVRVLKPGFRIQFSPDTRTTPDCVYPSFTLVSSLVTVLYDRTHLTLSTSGELIYIMFGHYTFSKNKVKCFS